MWLSIVPLVLRCSHSHGASTLARQEELGTPLRKVLADELLRDPVVRGRVDVVDAGVQYGIQDGANDIRLNRLWNWAPTAP
jgi:hypothetical protein